MKFAIPVLVVALAGVTGCAASGRVGLVAAETSLAADWHSTSWMTHRSTSYGEENPMLGLHPSSTAVNAYFVASMGATAIAWKLLPGWARPIAMLALAGFEFKTVRENMAVGTPW